MELRYSYEDIEPYEDGEDREGTMLAHHRQLGLAPPLRLAEPWELGADYPEVWDEFVVPGPFAHIDPAPDRSRRRRRRQPRSRRG